MLNRRNTLQTRPHTLNGAWTRGTVERPQRLDVRWASTGSTGRSEKGELGCATQMDHYPYRDPWDCGLAFKTARGGGARGIWLGRHTWPGSPRRVVQFAIVFSLQISNRFRTGPLSSLLAFDMMRII